MSHTQEIELPESVNSFSSNIITLRDNSARIFASKGYPSSNNEDYKYLSLNKIAQKLEQSGKARLTYSSKNYEKHFINIDSYRLVMVNGFVNKALSQINGLEKNVWIGSLNESLYSQPDIEKRIGHIADISDGFVAKNTSEFTDGWVLKINQNTTLSKPLYILNIYTGKDCFMQNIRNLIVMEDNTEAEVYHQTITEGLSAEIIVNTVTEVISGKNSVLNFSLIQQGCENLNTVEYFIASQQSDSHVSHNCFSLSGKIIRNNTQLILTGTAAECHLNGIFLPSSGEIFDNHTLVDHRVANCPSNELFKGIAMGKGLGIFNGKIFVRQDAQKTNAFQSNKNILLSDEASVYTKPQLEIYADDVKCSHGSTTGQLDEKALFYLKSRGIGEDSARNLLVTAFASEVVSRVKNQVAREYLEKIIVDKLNSL